MRITIRPVTSIEECRIIEELQVEIWGSNNREIAPDHLLITIAKEGGVVQLAFDDEQPVGFGYAFPGLTAANRLKLASHQAGVLPAYQDKGVGYQIKLAQREAALARNIDHITWTFDPLQGRNARFNLRKLGAICQTYLRNVYGQMRNELNEGLPSDRFKVDWWLTTNHVTDRITDRYREPDMSPAECPVLNPAEIMPDRRLPVPPESFSLPTSDCCQVEIPADIQRLKAEAPELAMAWHRQTREIFETAFAGGYTAIDLLRREGRNFYLLQKDWQPT